MLLTEVFWYGSFQTISKMIWYIQVDVLDRFACKSWPERTSRKNVIVVWWEIIAETGRCNQISASNEELHELYVCMSLSINLHQHHQQSIALGRLGTTVHFQWAMYSVKGMGVNINGWKLKSIYTFTLTGVLNITDIGPWCTRMVLVFIIAGILIELLSL